MNLQEERLSGKHVFKGRIIDLEVDQIQLPDGHNSIREVINHPGGVAIAALNERDELLMVRQFRYPFRTVLLELPAGKLEPGEIPLEAAKREQKEQVGHPSGGISFPGQILCHSRLLHGADLSVGLSGDRLWGAALG